MLPYGMGENDYPDVRQTIRRYVGDADSNAAGT